jgi:hypothetical protein
MAEVLNLQHDAHGVTRVVLDEGNPFSVPRKRIEELNVTQGTEIITEHGDFGAYWRLAGGQILKYLCFGPVPWP